MKPIRTQDFKSPHTNYSFLNLSIKKTVLTIGIGIISKLREGSRNRELMDNLIEILEIVNSHIFKLFLVQDPITICIFKGSNFFFLSNHSSGVKILSILISLKNLLTPSLLEPNELFLPRNVFIISIKLILKVSKILIIPFS